MQARTRTTEATPSLPGTPAVTFILPGDGRSGGVRVTVIMANLLLERGYRVRIACLKAKMGLGALLARASAAVLRRQRNAGFIHEFRGRVEKFGDINDLHFDAGEIVIAVGTYSMPHIRSLRAPVIPLRYNHGFPARPDALQEQAWRGRMPTITVSSTLVPRLEQLSGERVLGVVPNGIDTSVYFPVGNGRRSGIGAVLNHHPNKAPEDLIAILREAHRRWPDRKQHIFSTERCPPSLLHVEYTRLPSAGEAREVYNRCRVWLLTSRTEGLPGVVLEAMACGCVVISTDNDGSLEIIRHNLNGVIVPRGDRAAFLREIEKLMADDELAARLSAEAIRTAQAFTWQAAADRMERVLRELAVSGVPPRLP